MSAGNEDSERRYDDAAYAYGEGRFDEAMAGFSQLAESGDAKAATYMAEMYLRGEGVLADVEKGLEWLQRAASWGHSTAAYNLGALYRTGACGVKRDDAKSKQYFHLAKELGCELPVEQYF